METINEFGESELWIIRTSLKERYRKEMDIALVESDLRLRPSDRALTPCPGVHWSDGSCQFILLKTGDRSYRCQFFYGISKQYGTGIREYDDLSECIVSLLQAQADHESNVQGHFPTSPEEPSS